MGKIVTLEKEVYEKIAAGEVIENPLSVVKELVENSIDASADKIIIELRNGGKDLIRITDNGTGFAPEDIEKAFRRHSTSKFRDFSDFGRLVTLGFRGEALPSILEVSKIGISTSDNDSGIGIYLRFEEGAVIEKNEIPSDRGASISVSSLFYNLPVRKKFLKGDRAELNRIVSFIEKVALSNYDKTFTLHNNGKEIFHFERTDKLANRVYQVLGKEIASGLIPVDYTFGDYSVKGLTSALNTGIGTKKYQHFFVNGRFVNERTLYAALNNTYKNFLEKSMSPVAILLLKIPPSEVDVNIHPTKLEIKFEDPQRIYRLLNRTVNSLFHDNPKDNSGLTGLSQIYDKSSSGELNRVEKPGIIQVHHEKNLFEDHDEYTDNFSVIGQYRNSYIIIEKEGNLLVVDQHNADERSNYDKLKARFDSGEVETITPLFPLIFELSPGEMSVLNSDILEPVKRAGFEINILSGNSIDIKKYPSIIPESEVKETLRKIITGDTNAENFNEKLLADIACKSSIKVNYKLNYEQMRGVVRRLFDSGNPWFCPHKRPIIVDFKLEKIEKLLKRR